MSARRKCGNGIPIRALPPLQSVGMYVRNPRLAAMVDDATTDCHDESEAVSGLFTMIEDNLELPFETNILGVAVTVERIDLTDGDEIVAVCVRGSHRQKLSLFDLPLPSPPPRGAEWIEAYRYWVKGAR